MVVCDGYDPVAVLPGRSTEVVTSTNNDRMLSVSSAVDHQPSTVTMVSTRTLPRLSAIMPHLPEGNALLSSDKNLVQQSQSLSHVTASADSSRHFQPSGRTVGLRDDSIPGMSHIRQTQSMTVDNVDDNRWSICSRDDGSCRQQQFTDGNSIHSGYVEAGGGHVLSAGSVVLHSRQFLETSDASSHECNRGQHRSDSTMPTAKGALRRNSEKQKVVKLSTATTAKQQPSQIYSFQCYSNGFTSDDVETRNLQKTNTLNAWNQNTSKRPSSMVIMQPLRFQAAT
jgi:hypothetical protein